MFFTDAYSYFKKGCPSQYSILEPKGTVGFKQHKLFITVITLKIAKYRVLVHHNVIHYDCTQSSFRFQYRLLTITTFFEIVA